jgi:hypothetical protein
LRDSADGNCAHKSKDQKKLADETVSRSGALPSGFSCPGRDNDTVGARLSIEYPWANKSFDYDCPTWMAISCPGSQVTPLGFLIEPDVARTLLGLGVVGVISSPRRIETAVSM